MSQAHVGGDESAICVTNSVETSPSAARAATCELLVEYSFTGLICTCELCGLVVEVVDVSSCLPPASARASGAKQLATVVTARR